METDKDKDKMDIDEESDYENMMYIDEKDKDEMDMEDILDVVKAAKTNVDVGCVEKDGEDAMAVETDWYKPLCVRCPYFTNTEKGLRISSGGRMEFDVATGKDVLRTHEPLVKCERPYDIGCLAESPLIARKAIEERLDAAVKLHELAVEFEKKKYVTGAGGVADIGSRGSNRVVSCNPKRGKLMTRSAKNKAARRKV